MKGPRQTGSEAPAAPKAQRPGSELFIIDNADEQWKVGQYLHDWCEIARALDVATGYFEIGALLALDGQWQKLDQIRILMGDEVSKRTQQAFIGAVDQIAAILNKSIEKEKEKNDFLVGVPAIVDALKTGKIACRVYRERKFHAKAYITHAKFDVMGATALVGSSNFTYPGLHENVELNVHLRTEIKTLQDWYEHYWDEAETVTPEILRVVEHHTREYSPFEVYLKALFEYFQGHELTPEEWECDYPLYKQLDHYQKEGYHALLKKGRNHCGALLCDSVGLGKTFIGMMVIARLLHDRKRVALFVPKAAREPVWEAKLKRYLAHNTRSRLTGGFVIYNHTDLLRGGDFPAWMDDVKQNADVIMIDEAHHFRNRAAKTYAKLFELAEGKTLYLLTATPINNTLLDLQHEIELFSRRQPDYFKAAPLGIHSLPGHFRTLENAIRKLVGESTIWAEITEDEAEKALAQDDLFRELVVQRSRAYARQSQQQHGGAQVIFPERKPPVVVPYSLKRTYGNLLDHIEAAFYRAKPLLSLAMYYPLGYSKKPIESVDEKWVEGRQAQVVGLIRTQLLKRFESSSSAFQATSEQLLLKLLAFATANSQTPAEKRRLQRWQDQNAELLERVRQNQIELHPDELDEDVALEELFQDVEALPRAEFKVDEMLDEIFLDLAELALFLNDLKFRAPERDDKLQALVRLLKTNPLLKSQKVLIFSEYKDTARYLARELAKAGIGPLDQVDSASGRDRGQVITAFSPFYNDSSSANLAAEGKTETRVLISTDVLSEGLNLQDATLLVNYDLHWNPVRLMQRIGRVDRRLDQEVETRILQDHPEARAVRQTVHYWNFLPPDELDNLLALYERVAHKALRISKVFGIEGKKLLTPADDYQALKEFNEEYEGKPSEEETMRLAYQAFMAAQSDLEAQVAHMPQRVFSARAHPISGKQAVFFCYTLPAKNKETEAWDGTAGYTQWYLFDLETEKIQENAAEIDKLVRCTPETPRRRALPDEKLVEIRKKVEQHIKNTYLKSVQAPAKDKYDQPIRPLLKAWMELN